MTEFEHLRLELIKNSYQPFTYHSINHHLIMNIEPQSKHKPTRSTKEIDYYQTDDPFIGAANNLFILADLICYYPKLKETDESMKYDLYKYYKKHIQGRNIHDIHPDILCFYADWHEDVFGFRPANFINFGA